ncbi:MAG: helix-turn-helix domain-containing protein [Desulfobacula sp.]|jgi:putative transcriptional regulator|uniref:helix-turn-helix domain-containing protein n=1 Tax=Desulfobacula sp. TaxID=2593537 RepID=UPI001E0F2865|nr:helix-turn-helix domain-containing protein [Desulfobacula sp.]MBT4024497.1 helix-turn-helix domain-containing protein [Desulfobacula sp.]MBT4199817.1 helix-turn-helix domain-containing protein [Desulfobacula sp.]MBT4507807.1 helix-turn-helix domain-containing protein [Desulfobacula sp.]MBT5547196.1 helix-turn-helix domain-containing protein [Desulfobacula sp.]
MRDSIKKAVGETVQDLINSGFKTSFTEKELNSLGVTIPEVQLTTLQIKEIREELNLSQAVFARLLNVSPSSIRQWEQGKRKPTGATRVLLDLLKRSPHILNYRLRA